MKAPVPRPALRLVDKTSRSCSRTPEKAAGQRAAEPSKRPAARFPIPARSLIQTGMEGEPFGGTFRPDYPSAKTGGAVNDGG